MKIIKKDSFRSKPGVNMSDDMYRIVLDCPKNKIGRLEKFIKKHNKTPKKCKCESFYNNQNSYIFCPWCGRKL